LLKNNTILRTGILIGMLTVVGTTLSSPVNLVFAAGVFCPPCEGTEGNDTISGSKADDRMDGNGGNDRMSGQGGNDRMDGGDGNDIMVGGPGRDNMVGELGKDVIIGGDDADDISAGFPSSTRSDGSRDIIFCGAGNDEVWTNISIDHDTATGCETVHAE
jgi:Ca2+-binding RTX toxin-like protein